MSNDPSSSNCTVWSDPMTGSDWYKVPFYPDGNATYWFFAISRSPGDTTGLRLKGEFGHARYQSLTIYDSTGNDIATLRDDQTKPDEDALNPFQLAIDRDTQRRSYTVDIVPGEASGADGNTITFADDLDSLSVFLRVYLPDGSVLSGTHGLSGGVPLPTVTAFDVTTGVPAQCPDSGQLGGGSTSEEGGAPTQVDGRVRFYNLSGGGLYPNPDNAYLTTLFEPVEGTVAVLRFKPPTFADTYDGNSHLRSTPEVRYWSLNVGGQKATVTSACLADYQAIVAEDGYVNVVLGPQTPDVEERAQGLNFLPWGVHDGTVLIYRNMAGNLNFPFAAGAVPTYDSDQPQDQQSAELFIGDFAPVGVQCSVEEFLENYGGVPVSFA